MTQEDMYKLLAVNGDYWSDRNLYDFTTPDGAFWLMKRLDEWDRRDAFINSLLNYGGKDSIFFGVDDDISFTLALFTWLGEDPSALYRAIEEFMEVG